MRHLQLLKHLSPAGSNISQCWGPVEFGPNAFYLLGPGNLLISWSAIVLIASTFLFVTRWRYCDLRGWRTAWTCAEIWAALTLSKSCYYHIRELRCIRPYLNFKTASTIATSIVHFKLDYCNSRYQNLPNHQLNRLQQIQNSLARAVFKAPKSSHITPILRSLHWLKVNERIEYKLLSLTYKVLTTSQQFLQPAAYRLSPFLAHQPSPHWKMTDRSFRYASPRLWNQLPDSFRQPQTSHVSTHLLIHLSAHLYHHHHSHHPSLLHSRLKTYLFNKFFPP